MQIGGLGDDGRDRVGVFGGHQAGHVGRSLSDEGIIDGTALLQSGFQRGLALGRTGADIQNIGRHGRMVIGQITLQRQLGFLIRPFLKERVGTKTGCRAGGHGHDNSIGRIQNSHD